jgi:hypothetical protein
MITSTGETPNHRYGWYVVFVLIVAHTFSNFDRTILSLMLGPIRALHGISDVELSLLHGLGFALFYKFLSIPVGRLVDRRKRTTPHINIGTGDRNLCLQTQH